MLRQNTTEERATEPTKLAAIFDDYEARSNFVDFFDKLYEIDRRLEPERYEDGVELP